MRNLVLMWVLAGGAVALLAAGDGKPPVSTFTDKRDGKVYRIVEIGSQTWFVENLNYAAEGSRCYNNSPDSCAKYGRLYNWKTALKACPAGTHLPSDEEWTTLTDYVGGGEIAGKKLKSASSWNWNDDKGTSGNGTDDFGFSALSGGFGYSIGGFNYVGYYGSWWSSTEGDASYAWTRFMGYNIKYVVRDDNGKTNLYAVRCLVNKEAQK
jgi:uncharacterized protein (TIGR02145 family)